jgi:hypothetical protein
MVVTITTINSAVNWPAGSSFVQTDGGQNQGHLPARHHAAADGEGGRPGKTGKTCARSGADQFRQDGDDGEDDDLPHLAADACKRYGQPDADEKDGHEDRVGDRFQLVFHRLLEIGPGDGPPGGKRADNAGYTQGFGQPGKKEAHDQPGADYRLFHAQWGQLFHHPGDNLPAQQDDDGKKRRFLAEDEKQRRFRAAENTHQDRQGCDHQNVVHNRRAENGRAFARVQLAQLLYGLDRDAYRCGRQQQAEKDGVDWLQAKKTGSQIAACKRHQHPADGNGHGGVPVFVQIVQIGFQSSEEHEKQDAYLAQLMQHFRTLDYPQHGRTNQDAAEQLAEDGRLPQAHTVLAGQLGHQQDDEHLKGEEHVRSSFLQGNTDGHAADQDDFAFLRLSFLVVVVVAPAAGS